MAASPVIVMSAQQLAGSSIDWPVHHSVYNSMTRWDYHAAENGGLHMQGPETSLMKDVCFAVEGEEPRAVEERLPSCELPATSMALITQTAGRYCSVCR